MTRTVLSSAPVDFARLRSKEYGRLDANGDIYLDYTGACVYPDSLIRSHLEMLGRSTFGNPHSTNPTSLATTDLVERTRSDTLDFFGAIPDEYDVVFTLNATGALKLLGESYPFNSDVPYALTYDNHNSVNGIREFARAKGARFSYVPITDPDLRIDAPAMETILAEGAGSGGLLAFPAQSNFSGVQHDLSWISRAQELGWHVLLDAAAFAPTNRLDLSVHHPDFVPVSFYKMFGYPTGVGALLLRKQAAAELLRPWFAGGTVLMARACTVPCDSETGFVWEPGAAHFEDGTVNFLDIPAVRLGLEYLRSVGIENVHNHVMHLTAELLAKLVRLQHRNGSRLVHIYGPEGTIGRGGTVAMNLFDAGERLIQPAEVERAAAASRISIRTGCHCNPGAGQMALHISDEELEGLFKTTGTMSWDRFRVVTAGLREGAVRVSVGIASNEADVNAFVGLIAQFLD